MRLLEQDQQDPEQEQPPAEAPPEPPAPDPETVPLSTPAELRYIEDVLLAALMSPPQGEDETAILNLLDMLKTPDAIDRVQGGGMTAKDLYDKEILPIIRRGQQDAGIRSLSDQMAQ